jgi:hypothetical protein
MATPPAVTATIHTPTMTANTETPADDRWGGCAGMN